MLLALRLLANRHRIRLVLKGKHFMTGEALLLEVFTLIPSHSVLGKLGEPTRSQRMWPLWKKETVI
jgi:hypothetical protein